MNGSMSREQVVLLVLLLLIPLVQFLLPVIMRRLEELAREANDGRKEAVPRPIVVRMPASPAGEAAPPRSPRTLRPHPPVRIPAPLPETRRKSLAAIDLQQARRAIVAMTILGPCRALEPRAQRDPDGLP